MKKTCQLIWNKITSKTLALWLIGILAFLAVISMIVPQMTYNPQTYTEWARKTPQFSAFIETLQFHKIYKSFIFLSVTLLFTTNLFCCTIKQFQRAIKLISHKKLALQTKRYPLATEINIITDDSNFKGEILTIFNQAKYKITEQNNIILAEKGQLGVWGAPIFHVGLIIIILGGLITNYFSMEGYFKVSEGEVFQESHQSYFPGSLDEAPLFKENNHPGYLLKLEKQDRFFKGKLLDYTRSYIAVGQEDGELNTKGEIERGNPFKFNGITFYHKDSGFSPELIFKKEGQVIGSTIFSLNTIPIADSGKFNYTGVFNELEAGDYNIKISFYPDLIKKGNNRYDYDSMDIQNPALHVEILKHNQSVFKGLLKRGQWAKFDDFEMSFDNIFLWVGIDVVKDPGANVLFIGFFISLLGLIIIYGIVPKKIYMNVKPEKNGYQISGHSSKFQLFFQDEFNQLVNKLRQMELKQ